MTVPKADSWEKCARGRKMQITKTQVTDPSDLANNDVTQFAVKLCAILTSCTDEDASRICRSLKDGTGSKQ